MKPKELFIGALVLHEDQPCIVEHIEKAGLIGCHICGTKKYIWVAADSLDEVCFFPVSDGDKEIAHLGTSCEEPFRAELLEF